MARGASTWRDGVKVMRLQVVATPGGGAVAPCGEAGSARPRSADHLQCRRTSRRCQILRAVATVAAVTTSIGVCDLPSGGAFTEQVSAGAAQRTTMQRCTTRSMQAVAATRGGGVLLAAHRGEGNVAYNETASETPLMRRLVAVMASVLILCTAVAAPFTSARVAAEDDDLGADRWQSLSKARRRAVQEPEAPLEAISDEEASRRRNTPSEEVVEEDWYNRGKGAFVAKCAGCHAAGTNSIKQSKSLFWPDLIRNGYYEPEMLQEIIRYGKGRMPGFAKDCAEKNGSVLQCGVIVPLSEETLRDVGDFLINRANSSWKGRG
mmetsp:Transcript_73441/g.203983  ORF Transcript_73441/g.203983 Transcript_73441/m.203983 type:complete len:321 (+) Transcript_73441:78-1040(+)